MKTLLITATFLSAVTFHLNTHSSYLPVDFSNTSAYLQDTTPKQNKTNMKKGQYKDIRTGDPLTLSYSEQSGMMYNGVTGKAMDFYVNASTGDTISGYGYVVNNYLLMQPDSSYQLDMTRIRSIDNRYWIMENNKELQRDKSWPVKSQYPPRRDSL